LKNLSARTRIFLLVLAAMLPILALTVYNGFRERAAAVAAERTQLRLIAELTAKRPEQHMLYARQLLSMMAVNIDELLEDRGTCRAYFSRMGLDTKGIFRSFGVILPDGELHCNSALPDSLTINVGDRPYFRLALKSGQFVVGEYQVGRNSGRAGINFGLPVLDAGGRVRAVLFAGLNLEKFIEQDKSWRDAPERLEEGRVTTIYDRNDVVLARSPPGESHAVGAKGQHSWLTEIRARSGNGVFTAVDSSGVPRLYAVEHVGLNPDGVPPISVVVSIPLGSVLAGADRALRNTVLGVLGVALLVLIAAWIASEVFVMRRFRILINMAESVRAGDFSVRSSLGGGREELSRLGSALDAMARDLQARDEQLKSMLQQLNQQAITDQLTGLPNRHYLWEALGAELARARRKRAPLAVLLFDIDHFKRINDRLGHEAGDLVLRNVAHAARKVVRESDIVVRYGGEEFVIVLSEADETVALARAQALRGEIAALRLSYGSQLLDVVTVSVGVVCSRDGTGTAEDMVRVADHAMYEAKQAGRDRVVLRAMTNAA